MTPATRTLLAAALALPVLAALPALPAGAITYQIDDSGPCTSSATCTGDVSVSGSVTVADLGPVALADVTDWTLSFDSPSHTGVVLTPANSRFVLTGSAIGNVEATASGLEIALPDPAVSGSGQVGFFDTSGPTVTIAYQFEVNTTVTFRKAISVSPGTGPFEASIQDATSPQGVTFDVPAVDTPPIPLPPALALMLAALGGLGAVARHRAA
ncbi:MAG: hypothetical protein AAFV86_16585 [Pseudomonadota bacterium]